MPQLVVPSNRKRNRKSSISWKSYGTAAVVGMRLSPALVKSQPGPGLQRAATKEGLQGTFADLAILQENKERRQADVNSTQAVGGSDIYLNSMRLLYCMAHW